MTKCNFEPCANEKHPKAGFGLCLMHYDQQRHGKSLSIVPYKKKYADGQLCSFDGCDRLARVNDLCAAHDAQRRKGRALCRIAKRRKPVCGICSIAGCGGKHSALGYCRMHYEILHIFGLQPEKYEEMLAAQHGVCAICRSLCVSRRRLAVDHDHETGAFRGLLCAKCNRALGLLQDDPEVLERAAAYLRRSYR